MSDIQTVNGNLLLNTDPTAPTLPLSVSRTDSSLSVPLAGVSLYGAGANNLQGVIAFSTIGTGSAAGPLQERMRVHTNGAVGIGTALPAENTRLNVVGGALAVGPAPAKADAAIHVTGSFGGGDRLLQMSPTGAAKPGLNLLASCSGANVYQWWAWGVTVDNNWNIRAGTALGQDGLSITPNGNVRVSAELAVGGKLGVSGDTAITGKLGVSGDSAITGKLGVSGDTAITGKLGIGTASPLASLQVAGGAIMPAAGNSESAGLMFPKNPGGGGGDGAWMRYYARAGEDTTLEIGVSNDAQDHIALMPSGNVGVGTATPAGKLEVVGTAIIGDGSGLARRNNSLAAGALSIGSINSSYGGGAMWNSNTAALLLETQTNTEIAVHDSGTRLTSLMFYEGDAVNRITIGRDMGWGAVGQVVINGNVGVGTSTPSAKLDVVGDIAVGGKHALRGNDPWLRLNQTGAFSSGVHTPGNFFPGALNVGGGGGAGNPGPGNAWVSGSVGVGTTTPKRRLHVHGDSWGGAGEGGAEIHASGSTAGYSFTDRETGRQMDNGGAGERWVLYSQGKVARLFTTAAGDRLTVTTEGHLEIQGDLRLQDGRTLYSRGRMHINGEEMLFLLNKTGVTVSKAWGGSGNLSVEGNVSVGGTLSTLGQPVTPRTRGWAGGIHTWDVEAEGSMWSRSGYSSGPRDLAENYLSHEDLEPGDVVSLHPENDSVVKSTGANDPMVIGVVSTKPGFLLNVDHDLPEGSKHFPLALCGRVPCKVVNENGVISKGDLLTTSSTPGHAMKAAALQIDGQTIYRPGTVIGKALSGSDAAKGTIEIFVFSS